MNDRPNRILTTHAGSLPRPQALVDMFVARRRGELIDGEALEDVITEATRDVVQRQARAGIDIVNDGEQARESFVTYVMHRMTGYGGETDRRLMRDVTDFPGVLELRRRRSGGGLSLLRSPQAIGPVAYTEAGHRALAAEARAFHHALQATDRPFAGRFMTAASPGIVCTAMYNAYYASIEEYVDAVASALSEEYQAVAERGYTLQIDAPDLAMERHTLFQDRPLEDFVAFVDHVVAAINRATAGIPHDRIRLHVCWGNYDAPHVFDVPLEAILPSLYRANVGAFLFSMANPRHAHEYHVFERQPLPEGVSLIAGVVETTHNYVEHPEVIAERIERIAHAIGDPSRLMVSPDCGFDTSAGYGLVAPDVAWAKLAALSEGAAIASKRLFG